MNVKDTLKALAIARKLGVTLNIIGPHGEGKSSVVRQYAKAAGMDYKEFRTGQAADAGDLTGLPKFKLVKSTEEGNDIEFEVTDFVLPDWFPRKKNTVVFFDEVNRGAKDILNGVFEAILDLSMKGIKMPEGCQVVSAMNPPTGDYSGVIDFDDKAFQSRFVHVSFMPTKQEFHEHQKPKYSNSAFLDYLMENENMMRGEIQHFPIDFVSPCLRSWETAFKLEHLFDSGSVSEDLFRELMQGIVGLEASTAAYNFKKTQVKSIKGKDIIEKYHVKKTDLASLVKQTIEKNRTDMVANTMLEIEAEFGTRKELTNQEANNVINFAKDLAGNPELQYTFLSYVTKHLIGATGNCEGFEMISNTDPTQKGLGYSKVMIELLGKTKAARQAFLDAEEKKKTKETV